MSPPLAPAGIDSKVGVLSDERFGLLMSIQPRFANAILEGTKTVELRRKGPRDRPDVVIIYGSGSAKTVLGVAQLKEVHTSTPGDIWKKFGATAGVTRAEFNHYFQGSETASALELTHPRRSGDGVPLSHLRQLGLEPPQSWRYVERQVTTELLDALGLSSAEPLQHRRKSVSWRLPVPIGLADLGLIEAKLYRPLQLLVGSVRCVGLGGVGPRKAVVPEKHRPPARSELD
ncbi:MAG: ASCH domain-containing protein [Nocardioides sp.]|nr:ASCH domain-containing protein [Nocardioides sp.]